MGFPDKKAISDNDLRADRENISSRFLFIKKQGFFLDCSYHKSDFLKTGQVPVLSNHDIIFQNIHWLIWLL